MAPPLRPAPVGRAARRAALGRAAQDRRRADRGGDQPDPREPAGRRHALELARHGQGERPVHRHGAADLARLRPAAAPGRDLQALDRPRLRRQGARRGRAVHGPAGSGAGPVRRREKPDPGARPHPAAAADAPGPGRASVARLPDGTARPRCSRRSMSPPGGSSANASPGTGPPSSVASSTRSKRMSRPMSTSTSSWTTTPPTKHRPSATGC